MDVVVLAFKIKLQNAFKDGVNSAKCMIVLLEVTNLKSVFTLFFY